MKEMNLLRSWRPRRPSAGLRRRILNLAGEPVVPTTRWLWSGLAPTMACALLTMMAISHEGVGLGPQVPMAFILTNQSGAAYATSGAQTEQNHLATVTFDWTNRSVFRSSIRFTPTTNLSN
jgi:hypothetical protein